MPALRDSFASSQVGLAILFCAIGFPNASCAIDYWELETENRELVS
jgi:hypothetical protein